MIENIEKEIESINNNLSILPTRTRKNKIEFNNYIDQQLSEYSLKLKEVQEEINSRYDAYLKKYTTGEDKSFDKEIDIKTIKCNDNLFDSDEKMNLKYYFYELSHYYNDDLEKVNKTISIIISKFKKVGIILEAKDFNYTEAVREYMDALLQNKNNIQEVFEDLYWKNPNLINQIELNFRYLYLKYKKKIDKFYEKSLKNSTNPIEEYINAKIEYINYQHTSVRYMSNLMINMEVSIADLKEKSISSVINEFFIEQDNPKNYDNLLKLKDTLTEYKSLMHFMYIIDDFKVLYEKKQEYKDIYASKYKEITKKEKELFKFNKKIRSRFAKKSINENKLNRNNCITELYNLYEELDSLKIKDYIYKNVNNDTSYHDLFKLATRDFNYLVSLFKNQNPDLKQENIITNMKELFEFVYTSELNIINNISIVENKNISQIISDRYRLINMEVNENKIDQDNIDSYLDTINNLIMYYDLNREGINLDDISFILYVNKLRNK